MLPSLKNEATGSERERQLRLRAEKAEACMAELFSTMPQAYLAIDRNWTITFANQQAATVNRMPTENFVGGNISSLWPRLTGTEVDRQFRRAMESRVPVHFEIYSKKYDAWFELNVHPTREGIGVYYQDVTHRRRAEEALRESERRYRAFTELNPQLILMADTNGKVTYANQRLLAYSGMTPEQSCGNGWSAAMHPDDQLRAQSAWTDALARDVDFEIEACIRRASDGAFLWFSMRGLPVRDEENKTLYWLGVLIDVDERKCAIEALKKSQQETERQRLELESLYRTTPVGLALFDPVEFRYLRLNDHLAAIIGLPTEEILGKTVMEIAPVDGVREKFQQVARGTPIINALWC